MLFSRKKFNVAFLTLSLVSGYMQARDRYTESRHVQSEANYVSQAKQRVRNARDWSVRVAKASYNKVHEQAKNAYAFTCQKTHKLYEKAKEHKFIAGLATYLVVETILKLSGNPTLIERILFLPGKLKQARADNELLTDQLTDAQNNLNIANNANQWTSEELQQYQNALRTFEQENLDLTNDLDKAHKELRNLANELNNVHEQEIQKLRAQYENILQISVNLQNTIDELRNKQRNNDQNKPRSLPMPKASINNNNKPTMPPQQAHDNGNVQNPIEPKKNILADEPMMKRGIGIKAPPRKPATALTPDKKQIDDTQPSHPDDKNKPLPEKGFTAKQLQEQTATLKKVEPDIDRKPITQPNLLIDNNNLNEVLKRAMNQRRASGLNDSHDNNNDAGDEWSD